MDKARWLLRRKKVKIKGSGSFLLLYPFLSEKQCNLFPVLFCFHYSNMANALANAICERCRGGFAPAEKIVNSNGELYHEQCFVCAQCFQQFPEGLFYEVNKLKYFSLDFLGFLFKV